MGVYGTMQPSALVAGQSQILSNAALGGAVLSQQVAISQLQGNPANVTIINQSAATLTVEVSANDAGAASYVPLAGIGVGPNSAVSFSTTTPFIAVLPSIDPGAGIITLCR